MNFEVKILFNQSNYFEITGYIFALQISDLDCFYVEIRLVIFYATNNTILAITSKQPPVGRGL